MKEGQESSNTIRSSSRASVARAMSTTPIRAEIIKPVDTWASPREQESRLQEYTLQKPQDPLEGLEYFERRNALDVELQYLMREKQTWTSELSRIPSTGGTGKTRAKLSQIETVLDDIDHRISTTRKRMRDLGVL